MSRFIRGHVIQLLPNNKQASHFAQACGVARLSYNWALKEWQRQYKADQEYRDQCEYYGVQVDKKLLNKPSESKIRKHLNSFKRDKYPFMLKVTKCSPQLAIKQLGNSFDRFFTGQSKHPTPRKKGVDDRFSLSNDQFEIKDKKIRIPNLGWVRMTETLRFQGKILSAKIFKQGGKWFASIATELNPVEKLKPKTGLSIGVDLGVSNLATLSSGEVIPSNAPLKRQLAKLRRLNKSFSRKKKGSQNREKAKTKLSRLHYKISCLRKNNLHQVTSDLVKRFDVIAIEDLNVKGMVRNRKLSRAISDMGFYEFKRQLIYKAQQNGKSVLSVGRFFPSSKMCSHCGELNQNLMLSMRQWQCSCNATHNRDENAAINILKHADKELMVA
ncbi:RNA-guided endonuclease InsQ/TnpB family protein [Acinetobacter sp. TSRC1-2]|uniref:RNA-guided endonuclease InsQ/TnpB family protein n=1 Tax=unclassified Acinetobacter TaxID=196816 RepID=UPI003CF27E5D